MDRVVLAGCVLLVAFGVLIGVGLNSTEELSKQVRNAFELLNFTGGIVTAAVAVAALTSWRRQFRHSGKYESLRNFKLSLDGGWAAEKLMDKLLGQIKMIHMSDQVYDTMKIHENIADHQKDWDAQCRKVELAWKEMSLYFDQSELSTFKITNRDIYQMVQSEFYRLLNTGAAGSYIEISDIICEFTPKIRWMTKSLNSDTEVLMKKLLR
ncbi:hypothetical protein KKQ10_27020 [Pseudomonas sp. MG-9]|uniref:hypothetical protein n=1 Tax=Pseudomonas sp. MG-9 TaxID=2839032 RepID=UPI001C002646|nr:hypothetical protein [Pseudomonas sp. MG-9]MBT9268534.1 hypothetical protein [Pseudomonas sp. MG-9]